MLKIYLTKFEVDERDDCLTLPLPFISLRTLPHLTAQIGIEKCKVHHKHKKMRDYKLFFFLFGMLLAVVIFPLTAYLALQYPDIKIVVWTGGVACFLVIKMIGLKLLRKGCEKGEKREKTNVKVNE